MIGTTKGAWGSQKKRSKLTSMVVVDFRLVRVLEQPRHRRPTVHYNNGPSPIASLLVTQKDAHPTTSLFKQNTHKSDYAKQNSTQTFFVGRITIDATAKQIVYSLNVVRSDLSP